MTEKLTKADIIENINSRTGISRNEIHSVIDEFFEELKDGLREGKTIELRGLGTFEVRVRKGKEKARNPKTGETVSVENHGVAVFRAGKELKDSLWSLTTEG